MSLASKETSLTWRIWIGSCHHPKRERVSRYRFRQRRRRNFAPFGAITEEHFDQIFNINVKGLLFTVQKALPLLKDGAAIILNASIVASIGMEAFSVYSATKAAVRSFARTWTTDLKARKIRVNVISPGVVPTEGYRSLGNEEELKQFTAQMAAEIPLGRVGQPDEIAKAVVFRLR